MFIIALLCLANKVEPFEIPQDYVIQCSTYVFLKIIFGALFHFDLSFLHNLRTESELIFFLHVTDQFSQHYLLKMLFWGPECWRKP